MTPAREEPNPATAADEPLRHLRCGVCGWVAFCTPSAVRAYAALGEWPRCCGEVMTLLIRVDAPRPPAGDR
jgi:hypothetical protein